MYSVSTKNCIIWELSMPQEEHLILTNEKKRTNYHKLVEQCREDTWKIDYDSIEVECRGFAGQSLCRSLAKIGIVGAVRAKAVRNITNKILAASKWIWLKRSEPWRKEKPIMLPRFHSNLPCSIATANTSTLAPYSNHSGSLNSSLNLARCSLTYVAGTTSSLT